MISPTLGDTNREYYGSESPGRADYWRLMAAPRLRMKTFISILRGIAPHSIADLGCGNGRLLSEIKGAFPASRLCGMDFSESFIEANRVADPSVGWLVVDLGVRQRFCEGRAGSFDAVIASEIIEHLECPGALLANALDLARPGGFLLLSTQSGRIWETERMVGHRRHFSAAEISELLHGAGWQDVRAWNAGFPFHEISKRLANISPGRTMRAYSGGAYGPWQRLVCAALRLCYRLNSTRRGSQLFATARRP